MHLASRVIELTVNDFDVTKFKVGTGEFRITPQELHRFRLALQEPPKLREQSQINELSFILGGSKFFQKFPVMTQELILWNAVCF